MKTPFNAKDKFFQGGFLLSAILCLLTTLFYIFFIGDFSIFSYLDSDNAWSDQKYYLTLEGEVLPWVSFDRTAAYYSVLMYGMFPKTMISSIVVNSLIFGFSLSILRCEKKKYDFIYSLLLLPVICYFSIGFTKEAPLVLGLALLNYSIYFKKKFWSMISFFILTFVKPSFAIIALPVYFQVIRKNIYAILIAACLFTPLYFGIIKGIFVDNYYYDRYLNLENSIRGDYWFFSIFGNLLAMSKIYLDAVLIDSNEAVNNLQSDILQYYFVVCTCIFILNWRNFFQNRTYIFLLIFLFLSMGPIYHFRYLVPLLAIWTFIVLPDRFEACNNLRYNRAIKKEH